MSKLIRGAAPILAAVLIAGSLTGCSGSRQQTDVETDFEQLVAQREQEIAQLRDTIKDQTSRIEDLEGEVVTAKQAREKAYADMEKMRAADAQAMTDDDLFPPAKPGECYTRVFVPATYEQVTERVLHKAATSTVKTIPAEHEWVEERVLVEPASYRLETVPAKYEWQEERILVREAHTVWKQGRGPVERVDATTGEIMCLVEVPAEYKTIRKQVEVAPATTKRVEIPAKYETVKVRRQVAEAREVRTEVPAEYQTVTRWVKTSDGYMTWREIICETNMGPDFVKRLQIALRDKGHNPGPIDGIFGQQTNAALQSYQRSANLAVGGLTYEAVEKLGL